MLIDKLASDAGLEVTKRECQSLVGRGEIEQCAVKLLKPPAYMNLSGEAVACLLRKYQQATEPGERLIVISDDLALPFGRIRIRARGSAGGDNGLKWIIATGGRKQVTRLRISI